MYDAIIVGARCAGSPTATWLARKGHKVLLVEKAHFPSDKPLSTHLLFKPGGAVLQRLGLLDKVKATNLKGQRGFFLDAKPDFAFRAEAPPCDGVDMAWAPRRFLLDKFLVDAAVEAKAELREDFSVDGLVFDDGRVVGIRGHDIKSGASSEERAKIVVGADGMNSLVAREVNAPIVHEHPSVSGCYFSYFRGDPGEQALLFARPNRFLGIFPTNDGLAMAILYFPPDDYASVRSDVEKNFMSDWQRYAPEVFETMINGRREERFIGTGQQPNYFRKHWGPGWALIGDAAIHHDSQNPSGITYALTNSEFLAEAIDSALTGKSTMDAALAGYEERVQSRWREHFDWLVESSSLHEPGPEDMALYKAMQTNRKLANAYAGYLEGNLTYRTFYDPETQEKLMQDQWPFATG